MPNYEKELDKQQLEAVQKKAGPALIIAGPGSGKTRTIVYRICWLIENGAEPESILLLTFTKKAANEMKERAKKLIGPKADKVTAGTFHHFANLILRMHSHVLGLKPNFTILDAHDSRNVLKRSIKEVAGNETKKGIISLLARAISLSKLRRQNTDELIRSHPDFTIFRNRYESKISEIAEIYSKKKMEMNCLDFDDLLENCEKVFQNRSIRGHYQERYKHMLIDEFQDTDKLQASIISSLYTEGKDLMVVGDDFQSIYSFRGAEIENILGFSKRYGAKVIPIESNYRSREALVDMINSCMQTSRNGIKKELISKNVGGEIPRVISFPDRSEEAWVIANMIEEDLANGRTAGVLFRAAHFSSDLETELSRRRISYELRGGLRFFEQRHIKDMISLLKTYENPEDSSAAERLLMLFPGIGERKSERAVQKVKDWNEFMIRISRIKGLTELTCMLSSILSESKNAAGILSGFYEGFYQEYMKRNLENWEEREADIEALISVASKYDNVGDFLSSFQLDREGPAKKKEKVTLSTIHQAKGLEWDSVYLICAAEGMLPISRSNDIDEERRLFYVSISRARSRLMISYPSVSGRFYSDEELEPSRFIEELPEECWKGE